MINKLKTIGILCSVLLLVTVGIQAQVEEKSLELSLEDCIVRALENNLDVRADILSPRIADIAVSRAGEIFLPQMTFGFTKRDTEQASYSFLDAGGSVQSVQDSYSARITQLVPTGGTFTFTVDGYKTDSNRSFQTINPRYGATMTFNFSQPLLRNFGPKTTRREIIVARNNLDISRKNFETNMINTIYSVEEAYWNYIYNIELLKVRQQSLKLAKDLLEKNQRSVEVGTMAPIEVLTAESEVATREADILQAQAQVRNSEDQLKTLMNLQAEGREIEALNLVPLDSPVYEKKEITFDEALAFAIQKRSDLEATRIDLENRQINLSYAKNQLLPDLSLNAQVWSPGISGNQILYLNNNALSGVIVGVIPGGATDALKDAFGFNYFNFNIGLTLTVPLNSIFSRANYAQARVNLEQAQIRLESQEQKAFVEIKTAVRSVETDYLRVQAYKVARDLAWRKQEAEEEKLKVGLSTNYLVLLSQREFRNAQVQELRSVMDYNLSLARLSRSMGLTLDEKNIRISSLIEEK
ncbi:TolC family protein [Acidobacteriota bacterium]